MTFFREVCRPGQRPLHWSGFFLRGIEFLQFRRPTVKLRIKDNARLLSSGISPSFRNSRRSSSWLMQYWMPLRVSSVSRSVLSSAVLWIHAKKTSTSGRTLLSRPFWRSSQERSCSLFSAWYIAAIIWSASIAMVALPVPLAALAASSAIPKNYASPQARTQGAAVVYPDRLRWLHS